MDESPLIDPETLEQIRLNVLMQFSTLMQLHSNVHNFGENIQTLIEQTMEENIKAIAAKLAYIKDDDLLRSTREFAKHNERLRNALTLLHIEQERFWQKSKLYTQQAMLGFNEIAHELALTLKKLEYYSMHDPLTELHNRRYFNTILAHELSRSERYHHPFCLLMIDVDDFKQINDTYGHSSGDAMLKQLAMILLSCLRKTDTIGRIGGDEFAIILTETSAEAGASLAESLRKMIKATSFEDTLGNHYSVKVSIGVACYPRDANNMENLLSCVDIALYEAKRKGKDEISVFKKNPDYKK